MFKKLQTLTFAFFALILSANAQIIFSEDFNGGNVLSNWTVIDNDGNTVNTAIAALFPNAWVVSNDLQGTGGIDSVASSTSWYTPGDTADDYLITPAISLTNNNILEFQIRGRDAAFLDRYELYISTTTPTIAGLQANVPLVVDTSTNAWTTITVDLQAAGYSNQTVYFGWRNNSIDKFILDLDDVVVFTPSSDASALAVVDPVGEYTQVPLPYADTLRFAGFAVNSGIDTISNLRYRFNVYRNNSVVFTDSTASRPTTFPGDTAILLSTANYPLTQTGTYYVEYITAYDGTDSDPSNNTIVTDSIVVTDSTFARDNGQLAGSLSLGAGATGEIGQEFYIDQADTLTSVTIFIQNNSGAMTGQPLSLNVRNVNGTPGPIIASSDTVIYTATGAAALNLTFNNAGGYVALPADTFMIGVVEGDSALTLAYSNAEFTPGATWVQLNGTWRNSEAFNFLVAYFVRPNLGTPNMVTSIVDLGKVEATGISVYPNPSNGLFTLDMIQSKQAVSVDLQVQDISGKVVYREQFNANSLVNRQINLSDLSKGIYFMRVDNGIEQFTKKLIIK